MASTKYIYIIILAISLLASSCFYNKEDKTSDKQGIIIYELECLTDKNEVLVVNFLPSTMTYSFIENKNRQEVVGWGGVFRMGAISDNETDSVAAYMKIIGSKFRYTHHYIEDNIGYVDLGNVEIEYQDGSKKIAGYTCKRAIAHTSKGGDYELYYTEELPIDKANRNFPFKDVKGVLMEFPIDLFNVKIIVRAKEVLLQKQDLKEFIIPEEFSVVDKKEIEDTLRQFL